MGPEQLDAFLGSGALRRRPVHPNRVDSLPPALTTRPLASRPGRHPLGPSGV